MELIYTVRRKPLKCEPPYFDNSSDPEIVRPLVTISVANIIAFSSPTELSDVEGDTWGGHVYVCDLETPWDSHKVTSTTHPISALEWDNEGKQLLVATAAGDVSVYGQKDYLLNDWTCLYSASFPGEHIIKAILFENGRRVVVNDKAKPDAPLTERFQLAKHTPTLKGFGGTACWGAVVVTASGLVGAVVPAEGGEGGAHTHTHCLRPTREHVTHASLTYNNGGVVVSCSGASGAVCARVSVSRAPPALRVHTLPTLCMQQQPLSVSWWGGCEYLCVGTATALQLWRCADKHHTLHKLLNKGPLQGSTTPGGGPKPAADCFNTLGWTACGSWAAGGRAVCGAQHAVVYNNNTLTLVSRDGQHIICSRQLTTGAGPGAEAPGASPPKKPKYGPGLQRGSGGGVISEACISSLGGACVVVDTHAQLHVYRLPQPWGDIPSPIAVQLATNALEYALVTGYDCLDLILTYKPNIIELVYERLTESFQRQAAPFQQHYYYSWMKIRIALCRCVPGLQCSASWLTCIATCGALLAALALALRPDDRPEQILLDDEDDKTLLALESKPELLSDLVAAGPLRLGLQRAADTALTALTHLPAHHAHGYEVWCEAGAVSTLRRLVCVWRGAGGAAAQGGQGAGGVRADSLGRLLAAAARLTATPAIKHEFIEECQALAASSSSVRVWESLPRTGVSAPHGRPYPLYLEYGTEPEALRYTPEAPAYARCDTTPSLAMDAVRYMYLGGGLRPAKWRQCSRCGSRAMPAAVTARHPIQKAYDSRFIANCRCGGRWTLCSNV